MRQSRTKFISAREVAKKDDNDTIEVLSSHVIIIDTPTTCTMDNSKSCDNLLKTNSPVSGKRKFASRVVAIVAIVFLVLICILLGISFSMSKNIDDMGKS